MKPLALAPRAPQTRSTGAAQRPQRVAADASARLRRFLSISIVLLLLVAAPSSLFAGGVLSRRRTRAAGAGAGAGAPSLEVRSLWSAPRAQPPPDASSLVEVHSAAEPEPIHIAYTICGQPHPNEEDMFGLLSLKSLLIARANSPARERRYVVHIMSTQRRDETMRRTAFHWDIERFVRADPLLELRFYLLEELDAAVRRFGLDPNAIPHTVFKNCAASRLKLPFALDPAEAPAVLYLDWDTLVTCSLELLWAERHSLADGQLFGFALNDPTGLSEKDIYHLNPGMRVPPPGAVSSGVMLLDVAAMHAGGARELRAYWRALGAIVEQRVQAKFEDRLRKRAEEGAPALNASETVEMRHETATDYWILTELFPLGDQDMLNHYLADRPALLHVLAPTWNWCLADLIPYEALRGAGFQRSVPCVLHLCGARLMHNSMKQEGSPDDNWLRSFFTFVKELPLLLPEDPPGDYDGNF